MTLIINLSPAEEDLLFGQAFQGGLEPAAFVEGILRDHLMSRGMPTAEVELSQPRFWQSEGGTITSSESSVNDLFAKWAEEDALMCDEEVRADDRLWHDI